MSKKVVLFFFFLLLLYIKVTEVWTHAALLTLFLDISV